MDLRTAAGLALKHNSKRKEGRLQARIEQLETTFRHYHKKSYEYEGCDACASCGLDLRDRIHFMPPFVGGTEKQRHANVHPVFREILQTIKGG